MSTKLTAADREFAKRIGATNTTDTSAEAPKHTPIDLRLPWHIGTNGCSPESGGEPAFPAVYDNSALPDGGDCVAQTLGDSETVKARSAFIVRAVNSHDELLAALKQYVFATTEDAPTPMPEDSPALIWARAAIARAEGRAA